MFDVSMNHQEDSTNLAAAIAPVNCGQCGIDAHPFLHHVSIRGSFPYLCTSCVLRRHPLSFCPTCFVVFEPTTNPGPFPLPDFITCSKCSSSTHSSCLVVRPTNSPYICPLCSINPNSPIFEIKDNKIDKKAARVLLTASKIASDSMNKAAGQAKLEAEHRAKEAASARKRAKEAMEHLARVEAKEKASGKSLVVGEVSGSVGRSGIANSIVANVMESNLFGERIRVDSSSAVLAALNKVELREKERVQGVKWRQNGGLVSSSSEAVPMEVDKNGGQNNGTGNSGGNLGDRVSSDLVPVLNVEPITTFNSNKNSGEGNGGSQQ